MSDTMSEARRHWERVAPAEHAMRLALDAHNKAWKSPRTDGRGPELSADLGATRRQAALLRNPAMGEPRYAAELQLWREAEARWSVYAERGMAPRQIAPDPLAAQRQRDEATKHLNALGARGVHLHVTESNDIIAKPAVLLNSFDRERVKQNKAILLELLAEQIRL